MPAPLVVISVLKRRSSKLSAGFTGLGGKMTLEDIAVAVSNVPDIIGVSFPNTVHYNPSWPEHPMNGGTSI